MDQADALAAILSKLEGIEATQAEQKREIAFIKGQPVERDASAARPVQRPRLAAAGRGRFVHEVDGKAFDPRMRAEMWRADAVVTCACGSHSYAQTQEIVGEYDIVAAQRPVMDTNTGAVVRQPFRLVVNPDTGESTVPEQWQRTPETVAHFKKCNREAMDNDHDLQAKLAMRMKDLETDPDRSSYDPSEGTARAVHAHMVAIGG